MGDKQLEELKNEVMTLLAKEKIMRNMLSTMEEINILLKSQSSKCLCGQSSDIKIKTKLNVLNCKYTKLKTNLDNHSTEKPICELVVTENQEKPCSKPCEQTNNLYEDNDSQDTNSIDSKEGDDIELNSSQINEGSIDSEDIEAIEKLDDIGETVVSLETNDVEDDECNEFEFSCEFTDSKSKLLCEKKFTSRRSLIKHVIGHSGPKPWFCEESGCDYRAVQRNHLVGHVRKSHTGRFQFKCDWPGCDFKGPSRYNVRRHYTMHTKEKPYKCDWPGCDFKSPNNKIAEHKRSHTGEKPYPCSWVGCDARFSRAFTLKNHLRTHTGEKPFKCDYPNCGYSSKQASPLTTHRRKHHNQQSVANTFSEVVIAEEVSENIVTTDE